MFKSPHKAALAAVFSGLLLASCGESPAPQPPPAPEQALPAPVMVAPPDHDESRAEVQRAFEALGKDRAFDIAAAVANATDWKRHYGAWQSLPADSPHKQQDVPCNGHPDYWHIRHQVAESIRPALLGNPGLADFLAARQQGGVYGETRTEDALSCVSLKDIMVQYALEHPEHEGARYHNAFLYAYWQEKNGDQAFPFYLW